MFSPQDPLHTLTANLSSYAPLRASLQQCTVALSSDSLLVSAYSWQAFCSIHKHIALIRSAIANLPNSSPYQGIVKIYLMCVSTGDRRVYKVSSPYYNQNSMKAPTITRVDLLRLVKGHTGSAAALYLDTSQGICCNPQIVEGSGVSPQQWEQEWLQMNHEQYFDPGQLKLYTTALTQDIHLRDFKYNAFTKRGQRFTYTVNADLYVLEGRLVRVTMVQDLEPLSL